MPGVLLQPQRTQTPLAQIPRVAYGPANHRAFGIDDVAKETERQACPCSLTICLYYSHGGTRANIDRHGSFAIRTRAEIAGSTIADRRENLCILQFTRRPPDAARDFTNVAQLFGTQRANLSKLVIPNFAMQITQAGSTRHGRAAPDCTKQFAKNPVSRRCPNRNPPE